jgi:spore germination protein
VSRKAIRRTVAASVFTLCALSHAAAEPQNPVAQEQPARPAFGEIWAYLMQGEESAWTGSESVTDVCYFSAGLSRKGRISGSVKRPVVSAMNGRKPRIHLVIAELTNDALFHFSLDPRYGVRPLLVDDICRVAEAFDGVQIDFEAMSRDDAESFFDFLKEIRDRLPAEKVLSVAVPARMKKVTDAYDYARIASIADRLVIMAYDEHWSTSAPGPVASLSWCARVVDYAVSAVPADRIVMGLPLYGRAWQDKKLARALRFANVQDVLDETGGTASYTSELGAYFEYTENVVVKVFYDDERSLAEKLGLYVRKGIRAVSFWRIGQGPPSLWSMIEIDARGSMMQEAAPPARVSFPVPAQHAFEKADMPR